MRPILNWQTFPAMLRTDPPASSYRGAVDRLAHYRPFSDERALEMNHADISSVDAVDGLLTKKAI